MFSWVEDHRTLVLLGVKNEASLRHWEEIVSAYGIVCEHFREADLDGEMTALAIHPAVDGRLFRKLRLI